MSSQFDEFPHASSQIYSDNRVHFCTPIYCQSATFVRPLLAFVLCFLRQKIIKQNHRCDESVSIGVIDQLRSANDFPNALRQINRLHGDTGSCLKSTRGTTGCCSVTHGLLLSDPRVAAQRPTGCCSATHGLQLSDPRVAAQRPTVCSSATHGLRLSDPRVAAQRPTGCSLATHGLQLVYLHSLTG